MKIAIHKSEWGYSKDWISYCNEKKIPFKIVNCYKSDIIKQVSDCDIIMWHHHHSLAKDTVFAKQLLFALEQSGKNVFPDFNTGWHFDDKLGQKYLLEAIGAPLVPTHAFYSRKDADKWVDKTSFPKVFKLRGGAGSTNVSLIYSKGDAKKLIKKAFGRGFASYDRIGNIKENLRRYNKNEILFVDLLYSFRRFFVSTEFAKIYGREKGYVLFQDFIPNNSFDIRVITIGEKAFAIKRLVRENDFRASGSGVIVYNKKEIDLRCISIAFEVSNKLKGQCVAYDFVFNNDNPLIVEINYGFAHESYFDCPGYWDEKLNWHEERFNASHWIIDLVVNK
tara:strand:+ start:8384 stop:9391 length:1008 start_codon:yes stop_codon:yes gene_type:complete